jgi:hypothetical protein
LVLLVLSTEGRRSEGELDVVDVYIRKANLLYNAFLSSQGIIQRVYVTMYNHSIMYKNLYGKYVASYRISELSTCKSKTISFSVLYTAKMEEKVRRRMVPSGSYSCTVDG